MDELNVRSQIGMPTLHGVDTTPTDSLVVSESCIGHLLSAIDPPHISRLVWSVVINPIDGHSSTGTRPDISDEVSEVVAPFLTDRDTSSTVVGEAQVLWVVTSLDHPLPHKVFRRCAHAVTSRTVAYQATTRLRRTASQRPDVNGSFSAAHASTQQSSDAMTRRGFAQDAPTTNDRAWRDFTKKRVFHLSILAAN